MGVSEWRGTSQRWDAVSRRFMCCHTCHTSTYSDIYVHVLNDIYAVSTPSLRMIPIFPPITHIKGVKTVHSEGGDYPMMCFSPSPFSGLFGLMGIGVLVYSVSIKHTVLMQQRFPHRNKLCFSTQFLSQ